MTDDRRTGLLGVEDVKYAEVPLSASLDWLRQRIGKFVAGGVNLIAGQPGIGKSRLSLQIALDLGRNGEKTLYVLTEEPKSRLKDRAEQMCSGRAWSSEQRKKAMANVQPGDAVYDLETLPSFLAHQVMGSSGAHHGVTLIVVDSVQGHGLHSAATRKYRQLYEFCRHCQSSGITTLLVAHVTKKGDIVPSLSLGRDSR
jgi:predicted ATP-dependent serine protease